MQPGDDFRTLLMRRWVAGVRPWTISILGVVACGAHYSWAGAYSDYGFARRQSGAFRGRDGDQSSDRDYPSAGRQLPLHRVRDQWRNDCAMQYRSDPRGWRDDRRAHADYVRAGTRVVCAAIFWVLGRLEVAPRKVTK
jgi:hypothetical protein